MALKRLFKRVRKVVKKVAVPLLVVGAVAFTAGAALGLPSMAGGWGGAVSGALGKVGITGASTIGKVLVGAATQAGYGAVIGGVTSMATGGKFMDGATKGAMLGAVTGGFMGGMGMQTDPLAKAFGGGATPPGGDVIMSTKGALPGATGSQGLMQNPQFLETVGAQAAGVAPPLGAVAPAGGGGGFWDYLKSPAGSTLAGSVISGAATGIGSYMEGQQASKDADKQYERLIGANRGLRYGAAMAPTMTADSFPRAATPASATVAQAAPGKGRYEYDPSVGRIVYRSTEGMA
jgi:hypothetical protein